MGGLIVDIALTCFMNPSGLSQAARGYWKVLSGQGFRVIPMWLAEPTPDGVEERVSSEMSSAANWTFENDPLELYVGHGYAMQSVKSARAIVGSYVFENHRLTGDQITACRSMDVVACPSRFCMNACLSSGVRRDKVKYLPYYLDSSIWNTSVESSVPRGGRFRFLYMNTWYERKGYDVLLRSWWERFSKDDPVELWIKTYEEDGHDVPISAQVSIMAEELGVDRTQEAPIVMVDSVMRDEELPSFMRSFDCYVSPHRSEGFGMNIWHAMAVGVPVVCTEYGGCLDFVSKDTAWPVAVRGMVSPSRDELRVFPHLSGTTWAEPDAQSLGDRMMDCLHEEQSRTEKASLASQLVSKRYSEDVVLSCLRDVVDSAVPGGWSKLLLSSTIGSLASQECPRYSSPEVPLRMVEL